MQTSLSERLAGSEPQSGARGLGTRRAQRQRERLALTAALVVGDGAAIAAAVAIAYLLRFRTRFGLFYVPANSPLEFYSTLVFWLVPLILFTYGIYRLYALDRIFDGTDEYVRVLSASTLAMIFVILASFIFDDRLIISRAWVVLSWALLLVCVGAMRFVMRRIVYTLRRAGRLVKPVIVVASPLDAADLAQHLRLAAGSGIQVARIVSPDALGLDAAPAATPSALAALVAETDAEALVVSAASVAQDVLARIVREVSELPVELQLVPGMYEILTTSVQVREVRGLPLVTMNKVRIVGYDRLLKQALDYVVATTVLLALAPVLLTIAALVKLTSPGPVFHRRRVVGQCGRRFDALKFRTMHTDGDAILARHPELAEQLARDGKLPNDPRITPIGQFLRRWSLDEVPQLLNVLRGQMSLVGPRMIVESELPHFGQWRENLSTVKPGLTGLWQISGRSNIGYAERVRLDMHYIRSYSIWSDIEILLRTIPAVFTGVGAY
ncbi:MAG TPA: sugar transferase [Thermomicrobiales bacterium]|nr:sugar transferase [Thermomicrobiales bacterium]